METKTKNPLKVNVSVKRDVFGNSTRTFTASLGETGWTADCPSKEGALQLLVWELTQSRQNEFRQHYARANGAMFHLYWAGGGWTYAIVRDENPGNPSWTGFSGDVSFESCKAKMLNHLAQWNECNATAKAA
jgi:hypothetical protein